MLCRARSKSIKILRLREPCQQCTKKKVGVIRRGGRLVAAATARALKIGVTRFERATSWSQTKCSSQAELHPVMDASLKIGSPRTVIVIPSLPPPDKSVPAERRPHDIPHLLRNISAWNSRMWLIKAPVNYRRPLQRRIQQARRSSSRSALALPSPNMSSVTEATVVVAATR